MLASASADQTIRLIVVPASFGSSEYATLHLTARGAADDEWRLNTRAHTLDIASTTLLAMLIALILVIIAILVQRRIVQS